MRYRSLLASILVIILAGSAIVGQNTNKSSFPADTQPAIEAITPEKLLQHVKVVSSDEFEGRAPGTKGEELTVSYITEQFKRFGLKPGNPNGSYTQPVTLVGRSSISSSLSFIRENKQLDLKPVDDYIALSRALQSEVKIDNSDLVFVGNGVIAADSGRDDYKGLDLTNKTVLILAPPPPNRSAGAPAALTTATLFENASARGAAAALIIQESTTANGFENLVRAAGRESFDVKTSPLNPRHIAVEGWIKADAAKRLFTLGGQDFDVLKQVAQTKEFKAVQLGITANLAVKNNLRQVESRNVVAKLQGRDPKLRNEYIIYSAHWDHLGKDERLQGNQIYHGALDNGLGIASILGLAEAFSKLKRPPRRSILFLAVTAEEKGLLGSKYYVNFPLYPLNKTLADINIDVINPWGRTKDITIVGYGNSTLDDLLIEAARVQGRIVKPDFAPEKRRFYRSDQYEFALFGVPALRPITPTEFIGKPDGFGVKRREEYDTTDYHKPTDVIKEDWDLSGAVEDLTLLLEVGYGIAQGDKYPVWKTGSEFKARRDEMLSKHSH